MKIEDINNLQYDYIPTRSQSSRNEARRACIKSSRSILSQFTVYGTIIGVIGAVCWLFLGWLVGSAIPSSWTAVVGFLAIIKVLGKIALAVGAIMIAIGFFGDRFQKANSCFYSQYWFIGIRGYAKYAITIGAAAFIGCWLLKLVTRWQWLSALMTIGKILLIIGVIVWLITKVAEFIYGYLGEKQADSNFERQLEESYKKARDKFNGK